MLGAERKIPPNDECIKLQQAIEKALKAKKERIARRLQFYHQTFQENSQWQHLAHEAILLQANIYRWKIGMNSISVEDWEAGGMIRKIPLNPQIPISQEIQEKVRKSKKQMRSLPHLEREIKKTNEEMEALNMLEEHVKASDTLEKLQKIFDQLQKPSKKKEVIVARPKLPYHTFWTASGGRILVGKRANDNESLTFRIAHGSDYWFHVADFSGSHVVLKMPKNQIPDQESINDAMMLAMFYSKAKEKTAADIVVTQCKYVKKAPSAAKGQVQISKHKRLPIHFDKDRLRTIKERKPIHL